MKKNEMKEKKNKNLSYPDNRHRLPIQELVVLPKWALPDTSSSFGSLNYFFFFAFKKTLSKRTKKPTVILSLMIQ